MKRLSIILIMLLILGCNESPKKESIKPLDKSEIIKQQSPKTFTVTDKDFSFVFGYPWEVNYKRGLPHIHQMFDNFFNTLRSQSLNESGYVFKGKVKGEEDEYGNSEIIEAYFSDLIIVDSVFYKEVNKFKSYNYDIKLENIYGVWTTASNLYNGKPKGAALFRQAEKHLGIKSVRSNVKKYWNLEKPLDTVYLKLPENYYDIK